MRKLRILVDMDGIVADTLPFWLEQIRLQTGVKAIPSDINNWSLHSCHPLSTLAPKQIYSLLNQPGFNANIPVMSGAPENLEILQRAGHEIHFLTARFGDVGMPETIHWMNKHFPFMNPEKQLGFFADKHRVEGDLLIDDKGETLLKYQEYNPKSKLLTIDYPYNQMQIPGVIRVEKNADSWFALRKIIEGISDGKL